MKRTLCLLLALLTLALSACGKISGQPDPSPRPGVTSVPNHTPTPAPTPAPTARPTVQPTPEPTVEPTAEPTAEPTDAPIDGPETFFHPLTGIPTDTDLSGQKPVAVVLNNLKQALPQQGISQADIIYEVLAEGGITRMLALYQTPSAVGSIGSVRSARLYFLELALGHDALFIHAGGSPEFYTVKKDLNLTTVDGVVGYYAYAGSGVFWRDRNRIDGQQYAYEHSLLTSGTRIQTVLTSDGLLGPHREGFSSGLKFTDEDPTANGQSASLVLVPFSNYKVGTFRYSEGTGLYSVEEYGNPYIDGNDGSQVQVTNLLVLRATTRVVDGEGRLSIDLSSGDGWYACGGKMIPITWTKGDGSAPLQFYRTDGSELELSRGKSYICIISSGRDISAE